MAADCDAQCVAAGSESGSCIDDRCVCVMPLAPPAGLSRALSSGGATEVSDGTHSLSITIGPGEPAGAARDGDDVEVGIQPVADPSSRGGAP